MKKDSVFEAILWRFKNNRFIAVILVGTLVIIGFAKFIDSIVNVVGTVVGDTKCYSESTLEPFPGGVVEINLAQQIKTSVDIDVEAVRAPKNRENSEYRYYDVFLRNTSREPITLTAIITDSELVPSLGTPKPSGDKGPAYPDVMYDLNYKLFLKDQRIPLESPYRIPQNGYGAFRLHLIPTTESKEDIAARIIDRPGVHVMSLHLIDSKDRRTLIVYRDPGRSF